MFIKLRSYMAQSQPQPGNDNDNDLHQELRRIINDEAITPLFQPIFNCKKGKLFGYETLSRGPKDSPLHLPEPLFAAARRFGLLFALDSLCRKKAIARFQQLALKGKLFINIDPNCLLDRAHQQGTTLDALRQHNLPCSRVVIELTEHQQVNDMEALKAAAAHYRSMGLTIAMDDLSAGYSNLQLMNELRPDFIKMDKYFVRKLSHDPVAREFTRAICKLARSIDCHVIAEGIEQECDLKAARKLKIDYAQGYLLGRPEAIPDPNSHARFHKDAEAANDHDTLEQEPTDRIGALCLPIVGVAPNTRAELVFDRLQKEPQLMAIPVVDNGVVVGICERNAMLHRFSIRYGHELYGSKPIRQLMNDKPLIADIDDPLDAVSPLVTNRPSHTLYEPVVLTEHNCYAGLVYVHDILEQITKQSITRAMECNPLTRLPGNVAIEREVNRRLAAREPFILCYIDLDNFKAFNDRYGYERGDVMIRLLADLLRDHAEEEDFIGHIGGDDFIYVIEERPQWDAQVKAMMEAFRQQAEALYDHEDITNGCIKATDRAGNPCTFGLASLSIGAVPCPPGRYTSHLETAEVAVSLKHQAKLHNGNALQIDRRHNGESKPTPQQKSSTPNATPALAAA